MFTLVCLPASAQTAGKNYVMTETMLNSSGTRKIVSVQYYDGLGRPSELAEGGISGSGSYLHTLQTYDALGREAVTTLPGVNSSTPDFVGLTPTSTTLASSYGGDTRPYSQTTYDALGRPVFISTPGQNWTGRGKRIEYITNGENEVRRYSAGANAPTLSGYYPIGSLKAERVTDEDGITATTYKDLLGRVVLERRGTGSDTDDTYYVYSTNGLLRFVLQPMYQENAIAGYMFRYDYDARGRLKYKYLPGCGVTQYWYDGAGRVIASRGAKRASRYRTRYFFFDGLGRLVVQGRASAYGSNADTPLITSRTPADGTAEICHTGYYVDATRIPDNLQLEIVNYYDDYAFLTSGIFTDSIPAGNFHANNSACTSTLKTADITATSDDHLLARVYYYDDKGRVIDKRENLLGGEFRQTTTEYSFTHKPISTTTTITHPTSPDIFVNEMFTYHGTTDKISYHDLNYQEGTNRLASYSYDALGRISNTYRNNNHFSIDYTYNIHGWLTRTSATIFSKGWTPYFQQELSYETGCGTPCFNGNISAMRWRISPTGTGHGYKCYYDNCNRLTEGRHTDFDFNDMGASNYSECMSYNRNSALTQLTRREGFSKPVDSLIYIYNGNRLSSIGDYGTQVNASGSFEFRFRNSSPTYAYNGAGDLTQDGNKGLTNIRYDYLGHPVRIQFRDGSCTKYVYAADGRKLREIHITAVEGVYANMGQIKELTPAQTMATDTVDYADNLVIRYMNLNEAGMHPKIEYHFDGGYMTLTPNPAYNPNPIAMNPYSVQYSSSYHYYIHNHQGNTILVMDDNDNIKQINHYYPYGGPWYYFSTNQGFQPFKYNGKELDRMHGLDWYDYGARRYDPAYCMFTQMDPLAEKYPHLNPYVYCAGNPVRYVDPDGRSFWTKFIKSTLKIGRQVATHGAKVLIESATYVQAVADVVDNVNTLTDNEASTESRVWAGISLASEFMPVSIDDINSIEKSLKHIDLSNIGNLRKVSKTDKFPKSINQLEKDVEKGRAPKTIKRFDRAHSPDGQEHVHFKEPKSALNMDGSWKDGEPFLIDKKTKEYLKRNGWKID